MRGNENRKGDPICRITTPIVYADASTQNREKTSTSLIRAGFRGLNEDSLIRREMNQENMRPETKTENGKSIMRKVCIIGCGGSGKSTLAVKLGTLLDLPVVHLDAVHWRPNWEKPPRDVWRRQHGELLERETWILDGNYGSTMKQRIAASDTVVLLALSRFTCLFQVFKRAVRHLGRSRPDLNPGCREQLPDLEFLDWIWNYNRTRLPGILDDLERVTNTKNVVILRSRGDVARFLNELKQGTGRGVVRDASGRV